MQRLLVLLPVLLLTACANMPGRQQQPAEKPSPQPSAGQAPAKSEFQAENTVLYHLLVAELAGARGDLDQAVDQYLAAAERSSDPAVAERAARIALYAGRNDAAERAARRWMAVSGDAPQANEVLAVVALRQNRVDEAVDHLDRLIKASGDTASGFSEVGSILQREAKPANAVTVLQKLVQRYPKERAAHYALGEAALNAGQAELALKAANDALALSPKWRDAYILRAQAYLDNGQSEKGLADLQRLLTQTPNDYDLRLHYARTLLDLSRTKEALAEFKQLVKKHPDDAQVVYATALLAMDAGQMEEARNYLLKLVNEGQRTDAAYYYLGRIAEQEGDYKGGIRWYSRVGGEYRGQAQLRIAVALADHGELEKARSRLRSLRRENPDMAVRGYTVEGDLLRSAGRLQDSLDLYTKALAEHSDNADLLYGRAMTAVQLDRLELAEKDLRHIIEQDPNNAQALNALGYTLVDETDRVEEGLSLIEKAYNIKPDDPAIQDSMGWAYYRMGKLEKAVGYLEDAHEGSDEPEIAAHLGEVLWKLGNRDRARQVWQDVLERDPDNPYVRETMDRLMR